MNVRHVSHVTHARKRNMGVMSHMHKSATCGSCHTHAWMRHVSHFSRMQMSHVTYDWVMSQMTESCIRISRASQVTRAWSTRYMSESCHLYTNESCQSCHKYRNDTLNEWYFPGCLDESCQYVMNAHCNNHCSTRCNTYCNSRCDRHGKIHCNTLQHAATRCNTLQHAATRCNTQHHITIIRKSHVGMHAHMGWLRLVGSFKLKVSLAKEPYKRDNTLQNFKEPTNHSHPIRHTYRYRTAQLKRTHTHTHIHTHTHTLTHMCTLTHTHSLTNTHICTHTHTNTHTHTHT